MSRHVRDEEGVTLVEMMVAILILGIILAALASTLVASIQSAGRQESDIQANAVANAVLEQLQAMTYRSMALCEGEATTAFGSVLTFEGEPIVVMPDADPQCSTPAPGRPVPRRSIIQDGRSYDVDLAITWVDDDGDGLAGADADGPEDYRRLVVDLSWQDRGRTFTTRAEARRAAQALEQPMSTRIDPPVTRLRDEGDGDADGVTGRNDAAFTLRAVHVLKQSSVTVRWRDRDGTTISPVLPLTSSGGFTWTETIPFNSRRLPNGETLFTFTATSPTGEVTTVVDRGLFLHDLEYRPTSPTSATGTVDPAGVVCDLEIGAVMQGMLLSDTVDVAFSHEPATHYAMSGLAQTVHGANFVLRLGGTAGFPVPAADGETTAVTATLQADRVVDGPATPIERNVAVTLTRVGACS